MKTTSIETVSAIGPQGAQGISGPFVCYIFNTEEGQGNPLGPLTNYPEYTFGFGGTADFPAGMTDEFHLWVDSTGAASAASMRIRDITNSQTIATITILPGVAMSSRTTTVFANLPAGKAVMEVQLTIEAGDQLLFNIAPYTNGSSMVWIRKK